MRFNMFDCEMSNSFINMTAVRMSARVEASQFIGPENETDQTNNRIGKGVSTRDVTLFV